LPASQPPSNADALELLGPTTQELVRRTERFHARIARLDNAWRERFAMHPSAIHRLRERIGAELGVV